jgi:hypothetical protein
MSWINYDITYCNRDCANKECRRNKANLPAGEIYVSMAEFADCHEYKEEEKCQTL